MFSLQGINFFFFVLKKKSHSELLVFFQTVLDCELTFSGVFLKNAFIIFFGCVAS